MKAPSIRLRRGREKSLLRRHPWIFSGAVERVQGDPGAGEVVQVLAHDGSPLGCAAFSPHSQIRGRIWSFDATQTIDQPFFASRLRRALCLREIAGQTAVRLVNAESDQLPGLVIDLYAGHLVCQFNSAGAERCKAMIIDALEQLLPCKSISERSDAVQRKKEGLDPAAGLLRGELPGQPLVIEEQGLRFAVDLAQGHKTGFYLDQRDSRQRVRHHARGCQHLLNTFSYTGSFAISALSGGAQEVTNIESSAEALAGLQQNLQLNQLSASACHTMQGDAFALLRQLVEQGRSFDQIILDPPKFVANRRQLERGCRGYKDINLQAFKLLKPGGLLFTYSCSGLVSPELFQKIVADAALDAERQAVIVERLSQPSDHPVALNFPEGLYLKGLLCRA